MTVAPSSTVWSAPAFAVGGLVHRRRWIVVVANAGAGSMKATVPGSGGVTVPGLQANLTLRNPPIAALMMMPPTSAPVATLSGVRVSSRNSIVPLGPAVNVRSL